MKIYSKKSYFSPIAELVIIDGSDDLLGGDYKFGSFVEGNDGEEAGAKPTGAVEYYNEIWNPEVVSETE